MNTTLSQTIRAIRDISDKAQHEAYAKQKLLVAGENVLMLLEHYEELKAKRPATYLADIMSGKMAKLFEEATTSDPQTSKNIIIVARFPEQLLFLTNAIKAKNIDTNLTEKDFEQSALQMIREFMDIATNDGNVRSLVKEKIRSLYDNKAMDEHLVQIALNNHLKSNY